MARARVVGADGDPHGTVVALGPLHRKTQAARVAVCGHDKRSAELQRRSSGIAAGLVHGLGPDTDDGSGALIQDRAGHVGGLAQARTVLDRVLGQDVVEVLPGANQAVWREAGQVRPGKLEAHAAADDAKAVILDPAILLGGRDSESDQLADGAGRQTVAADLLARKSALLQQQDVQPGHRQIRRCRRSARTGADDDDIGGLHPMDGWRCLGSRRLRSDAGCALCDVGDDALTHWGPHHGDFWGADNGCACEDVHERGEAYAGSRYAPT